VGCLQTMWAHLRLLWVRRPACLLPMWADKFPCLRANLRMIVGRYSYGRLLRVRQADLASFGEVLPRHTPPRAPRTRAPVPLRLARRRSEPQPPRYPTKLAQRTPAAHAHSRHAAWPSVTSAPTLRGTYPVLSEVNVWRSGRVRGIYPDWGKVGKRPYTCCMAAIPKGAAANAPRCLALPGNVKVVQEIAFNLLDGNIGKPRFRQ
jgi:hypothetical protein